MVYTIILLILILVMESGIDGIYTCIYMYQVYIHVYVYSVLKINFSVLKIHFTINVQNPQM